MTEQPEHSSDTMPGYVVDTPSKRRAVALTGLPLDALPHASFYAAHRAVISDLVQDIRDALAVGDAVDAGVLADLLPFVLSWRDTTDPIDTARPFVYGPDHLGTHYSIQRIEVAAEHLGTPAAKPEPQHWALCEVRGGIADLTCGTAVTPLVIDWDRIADEYEYAETVLHNLSQTCRALPTSQAARIREVIAEIWADDNGEPEDDDPGSPTSPEATP